MECVAKGGDGQSARDIYSRLASGAKLRDILAEAAQACGGVDHENSGNSVIPIDVEGLSKRNGTTIPAAPIARDTVRAPLGELIASALDATFA